MGINELYEELKETYKNRMAKATRKLPDGTETEGQYLSTKDRLSWFVDFHRRAKFMAFDPQGGDLSSDKGYSIEVVQRLIDPNAGCAYLEVRVTDILDNVGTGVGFCSKNDWPQFVEAAFTRALGRALAQLGFGTEAAAEYIDQDTYADAPVESKALKPQQSVPIPSKSSNSSPPKPQQSSNNQKTLSTAQKKTINNLLNNIQKKKDKDISIDKVVERVNAESLDSMTVSQASEAIKYLIAELNT